MSSNLSVLKPAEIEDILFKLGFKLVRQRGSHRQYRHDDGRATTIPFHGSKDISPILLRLIIKEIGLTTKEFMEWRKK